MAGASNPQPLPPSIAQWVVVVHRPSGAVVSRKISKYLGKSVVCGQLASSEKEKKSKWTKVAGSLRRAPIVAKISIVSLPLKECVCVRACNAEREKKKRA